MKLTKDPCIKCDSFEKRNFYFAQLQNKFKMEWENQYKKLYELVPIGLFRTRISDDKLLECNRSFMNLMGYCNKEECLSSSCCEKLEI